MSSEEQITPPSSPRTFRSALGLESRLLRDHPALIFTIGYAVVSLVGMMFSWSLFRRFGVNVFDYAEVTDFLMAALREPMTFTLAGGGVLMSWFIWWWATVEQRIFARRPPRSSFMKAYVRLSRWSANSSAALVGIIPIYAYLFISLYADMRADAIREGDGTKVVVTRDGDDAPQERLLLGTSGKYVFLYDIAGRDVEIVPLEGLGGIEVAVPEEEEMPAPPPSEPAEVARPLDE